MIIKELEIDKNVLEEINHAMDIFCEDDEDMREDYDVEPNDVLYSFDVSFENGYSVEISVNSGDTNCWIDFVLFDKNNNQLECMLDDSCGMYDGDIIEFVDNPDYVIKIKEVN